MTIQWLGHASFRITHQGYSIVIDPYNSDYINGYPKLRVRADRVLVSHEHFGHNYREGGDPLRETGDGMSLRDRNNPGSA